MDQGISFGCFSRISDAFCAQGKKKKERKTKKQIKIAKYVRSETTTLEIAIVDLLYRISSRSQKVGVLTGYYPTFLKKSH